jgi:hypothetical protein
MGDLIEQLRKRILTLNEQGIMPDLVRELEGSILKVEQLQAERDAVCLALIKLQQRKGKVPTPSLVKALAEHDAEVARKAITKAKETFVLRSNGNEDFQAGIDYCVDAYDKHLDQYAQRIKDGEL